MRITLLRYVAGVAFAVAVAQACGSGAPRLSEKQAEQRLPRMVLSASDIGEGYGEDVARFVSDEDSANARPDSDVARRQYAQWGQVLTYNVEYAAAEPLGTILVTNTSSEDL